MQKIEVRTSISRNNRDEIHIRVKDVSSRIEFVDVCLSLEDYALIISGVGEIPSTAEVRGLNVVGKERVRESRVVECPKDVRDESQWIIDNCQEEGWIVDPYLGSRDSKTYKGDVVVLKYSVYKFIDKL